MQWTARKIRSIFLKKLGKQGATFLYRDRKKSLCWGAFGKNRLVCIEIVTVLYKVANNEIYAGNSICERIAVKFSLLNFIWCEIP